jgi:hypothetical protein
LHLLSILLSTWWNFHLEVLTNSPQNSQILANKVDFSIFFHLLLIPFNGAWIPFNIMVRNSFFKKNMGPMILLALTALHDDIMETSRTVWGFL